MKRSSSGPSGPRWEGRTGGSFLSRAPLHSGLEWKALCLLHLLIASAAAVAVNVVLS